jgi:alkylation response protein AidB-like acyl-CoA dehydrogenase
MDFREPDHIAMLRENIKRFVATEMPREKAADWDKRNHFPRDVFDKLAKLGVMGLTVPEEYGGAGKEIVGCMMVIEELARRSCALAVPYIMSACYAGMNLTECASPAQKKALLPRVAAGDLLFAYGWTEPDVGGDLASVRTTAVRRGDEVVINGTKRFCSGAAICDYIYTLVRSDADAPRYENLSIVMIPPDTPGISITPIESLGMKGAQTTDVSFTDVTVPFANVMGEEAGWNAGWPMLVGPGLDVEKLEVAALALGIASAALEDAWSYSQERKQFGKAISSMQAVRHTLAEAQSKLYAARLMTYHSAWLAGAKMPCRAETSMAKMMVCELSKDIVLACQSVMGAYGYVRGFDMERYVRDILLMPIIGGSTNIQKNNIANALQLPR